MTVRCDIAELIERVVRECLADAAIDAVRVKEAADHDGETIYRITVIVDSDELLDSQDTASVTRHVRHELLRRGDEVFPHFAFRSKRDAESLEAEAA